MPRALECIPPPRPAGSCTPTDKREREREIKRDSSIKKERHTQTDEQTTGSQADRQPGRQINGDEEIQRERQRHTGTRHTHREMERNSARADCNGVREMLYRVDWQLRQRQVTGVSHRFTDKVGQNEFMHGGVGRQWTRKEATTRMATPHHRHHHQQATGRRDGGSEPPKLCATAQQNTHPSLISVCMKNACLGGEPQNFVQQCNKTYIPDPCPVHEKHLPHLGLPGVGGRPLFPNARSAGQVSCHLSPTFINNSASSTPCHGGKRFFFEKLITE